MIVNEIAKFEKPLQPRFSVLSVAQLGEALLVVVPELIEPARHCSLPSSGRRRHASCDKRCAEPDLWTRRP